MSSSKTSNALHASRKADDKTGTEMKQTASTPRASSPLFSLLAHYVTGGIDQPVWDRFMGILDADSVSTTERLAYARYMHDALIDQRGSFPELPAGDEMKGLLLELSASKAA